MRSDNNQLDLYDHAPSRMLAAAIDQLETAKVDPNFYGVVKQDRIDFYQNEVNRWKALCG